MKKALVLGAGGFIGNHMVERLKKEGFWIRGVDLKNTEFNSSIADELIDAHGDRMAQLLGRQDSLYKPNGFAYEHMEATFNNSKR